VADQGEHPRRGRPANPTNKPPGDPELGDSDQVPAEAIDPELAAQLDDFLEVDMLDVEADRRKLRAEFDALPPVDETGVTVVAVGYQADDGQGVPFRLYLPDIRIGTGALLYIHGGGFVFGDLDESHPDMIERARDLGVPVLSVGYRLAPENRYPKAVDDCHEALRWLRAECPRLGVDPARVVVHGWSAGGCLAAALALRVRDSDELPLHHLVLQEPVIDDRLATPSMQAYVETPCWRRPLAAASWDCYLGAGLRGTPGISQFAAPGRATDLAGFPPTSITVAQFDPLRDEAIAFSQRLADAGVPTEVRLFPGTFHASSSLDSAVSSRQREHITATLARAVESLGA
jgi:acetyl esterase